MSSWRIPLSDLCYGEAEEAAVLRVVRSGWLSMGPEVQAFEEEFAEAMGVNHAIACSSGTAALHLALLALEMPPGAEVIQPALNFVAAANMTLAVGATPVFGDIVALDEPTLDPGEVERLLSPHTRAVVLMHYGGYPARTQPIADLCRGRGIRLVEDACHAVGAAYTLDEAEGLRGRMCGTLGDVGCFSFFSNKNLATGEGGMLTTDDDYLAGRMRLLRSHGMTTLTWERHKGHASSYDVVANGYNYRLDEIRAALGRCQLAKLAEMNARRRKRTLQYHQALRGLDGCVLPFLDHTGDSAHHLMVVLAPDAEARSGAAAALKDAGIQTSLHYPCVADFTAFSGMAGGALEHSRSYASRVLTLPLFPDMTEGQVTEVCSALRSSCGSGSPEVAAER